MTSQTQRKRGFPPFNVTLATNFRDSEKHWSQFDLIEYILTYLVYLVPYSIIRVKLMHTKRC